MSGKANFRNIRPSFEESSASTSNPNSSTPETTGSDPRRPLDKDKEPDGNASKRRRVPEQVTRNACVNCKKARAKCDGNKPCKRCASRDENSTCVYEVHVKHAKEELVKQIKELRTKDHQSGHILQALANNEKVPEILERLRNSDTHESIIAFLGRPPTADFETLSPMPSHQSTYEGSDHEMGGVDTSRPWSTVTTETAILDPLFQLYFAWVHPVHTLFSEGHFTNNYARGLKSYCSPVLVNSICALACSLHTASEGEDLNYGQLGAEFSNAARRELDPEGKDITTIQAFAVMYLVDCAGGNALRATAYLRIATLALLQMVSQENDGFEESCKTTVRGIGNLNIEWAQMTFQLPPFIVFPVNDDLDEYDVGIDNRPWYPYKTEHEHPEGRPSMLATTNREKTKLAKILQDIATMIFTQRGSKITAKQFLKQYGKLKMWREQLPKELGDVEDDRQQVLPHVLYLLILHNTAVVQLLRPLLDFDGFPSSLVENVIREHSQDGLMLLEKHYGLHYGFRFQPVLQMIAALQLIDTLIRFFPGGAEGDSKDGPAAVQFGLELLKESGAGFLVAGPLQEMLRISAKQCGISHTGNLEELMLPPPPPQKKYMMDDFIGACTRPTYLQPVLNAHSKYDSSFSSEWKTEGPAYGFRESTIGARRPEGPSAEEIGAQSLMQIRNVLNTTR
ncbi:related to nitrate assimilation regulatory protein nirA [Rhynchosporium graminicola]|uniref:Related to nitrate assimilation regulatory protein nirA n=1 Tax=Rhynchosporium graminicola TaxID=2792576 RepID=A0A1E1KZE2_9HELO|nr:related to nitrate assimilation regulatory protein nirA [Rhynchosporium commune]